MRIYEDLTALHPGDFSSPVVSVGVFDGLHIGHRKLLTELREWASSFNGESVVVTFRAHPREVVANSGPTYITSLSHRMLLLEREGIDTCILLDFTQELAATSALEFSRRFLVERIGLKGLLMGFDSRIGRGGEGTPDLMTGIGRKLGFEVRRFGPVEFDGDVISSTRVRQEIIDGNLEAARNMLGRRVTVLGKVVKGEGRGRKLGFPTANLDLHHEARPPSGVYAAVALIDETERPALVSIGRRGTFHPDSTSEIIEVHIPQFQGDLYEREMEVRFIAKIREQHDFGSADELIEQMKKDAQELERMLPRNRP